MDTVQLLCQLIRVAVCGMQPTEALHDTCTPEALQAVYALAKQHDLGHLAGQGASKLGLSDSDALQACKKAAFEAFLRYTRQNIAYVSVCELFEKAQIPFIPLKGSVLRDHYPEPWMRTSCDMDILIHEEDIPRAQPVLEDAGWKYWAKCFHDISFLSADGIHLELHFTTIEDYVSEAGKQIMEGIWEDATPLPGKQYHMVISDALFYYYHMVHMAKHFQAGGCGIRTFLDIWVLNHRMSFDKSARRQVLERGQLAAFAHGAEVLAEIWFSGAEMDENSRLLQSYVLNGGTYGTLKNQVSLQQEKKGSKLQFILNRIFQPYEVLKLQFPIVQTHKWLVPVFQVVRWFRLLRPGQLKRSRRELQANAAVSQDQQAAARALLQYLEL